MTRARRLLVVSHPAVLAVNQLPYAALAQRGWTVEVITPDRWKHDYGTIEPQALPELCDHVHPLPVVSAGRPQRHGYRVRPTRLLRRFRPDAVFLEQEPFSVAALQWGRAAARAGIPFGVQAAENLDRPLPAPVRAWCTWVLRRAAFVAARSERAADLVRAWGAAGRVEVIPHHVPEWPVPVPVPTDRPNGFAVGYAGRLVPEEGLDVLVDAVRRIGPGTELVVVGDGPLRGDLERADLGGANLRLLTGIGHDAMAEAYSHMDVLVLPSRTTPTWTEQFGRVLVEALWCGVPVIGSDSGEIPWVITTTGGGRVVPEGDPEALRAAIVALRDDPDERHRFAERGRAEVAGRFSVPAVADALEATLTAVVGAARPRVALVVHDIGETGGMERVCTELVRNASDRYTFTLVANRAEPAVVDLAERWVRIRVPRRPFPLKFVAFFLRAGWALRRLDVDLVHTVGAIVPNRVDVAAVHFCHAGFRARTGRWAPTDAPITRRVNTTTARLLATAAERWCYRTGRLRMLAPVSTGVAHELAVHFPKVPVTVIPNGVDVERFRPDARQWAMTRREMGVPDSAVVALFVGGDWRRKGLHLAIEAVAKARTEADIHLWVVGVGDDGAFRSFAADMGAGDAVEFLGFRTDTERWYQAADLFVLPSEYETFSLVCFEAAACGLPLVIPHLSGAEELVGGDEAGIMVERDSVAIAGALVTLAGDPALRRRLGARARERAHAYSWSETADRTVACYDALLARSAR